jgi:hypothetical protein
MRGVGALRLGLPSGSVGVGWTRYSGHCAKIVAESAVQSAAAPRTFATNFIR